MSRVERDKSNKKQRIAAVISLIIVIAALSASFMIVRSGTTNSQNKSLKIPSDSWYEENMRNITPKLNKIILTKEKNGGNAYTVKINGTLPKLEKISKAGQYPFLELYFYKFGDKDYTDTGIAYSPITGETMDQNKQLYLTEGEKYYFKLQGWVSPKGRKTHYTEFSRPVDIIITGESPQTYINT